MPPPADIHLLVTRLPYTHCASSPCNVIRKLTTGRRRSSVHPSGPRRPWSHQTSADLLLQSLDEAQCEAPSHLICRRPHTSIKACSAHLLMLPRCVWSTVCVTRPPTESANDQSTCRHWTVKSQYWIGTGPSVFN